VFACMAAPPNMDGRHGPRGGRSRNLSHEPPIEGGGASAREGTPYTGLVWPVSVWPKKQVHTKPTFSGSTCKFRRHMHHT
jgi:hypothetical protein